MQHASMHHAAMLSGPAHEAAAPGEGIAHGEGLLHDALNLMGAVGLYCDLLLTPGVLKPQHRRYAEELRLLGARSGALMGRLTLNSAPEAGPGPGRMPPIRPHGLEPPRPVSLRAIVERCSGLLSRVAGGRPIEVSYGAAAAMPVLVAEESVERILANLVRNSAAALDVSQQSECENYVGNSHALGGSGRTAEAPHRRAGDALAGPVRERPDGRSSRTADETPGAIRIGVGLLVNRVGESRPWPFQRVRLAVEDSGCGMTAERLEQVLTAAGAPTRNRRGIGLRVVQELVAASHGELRLMSAPGVGPRVQIEWPIAALAEMDRTPGIAPGRAQDSRHSPTPGGPTRRDVPAHADSRRSQSSAASRQSSGPPPPRRTALSSSESRASRLSRAGAARSRRPADSGSNDGRWAAC
jgi:signal transduction histidine kinase